MCLAGCLNPKSTKNEGGNHAVTVIMSGKGDCICSK